MVYSNHGNPCSNVGEIEHGKTWLGLHSFEVFCFLHAELWIQSKVLKIFLHKVCTAHSTGFHRARPVSSPWVLLAQSKFFSSFSGGKEWRWWWNDPKDQFSCSRFCWVLCQLLPQVLCPMPDIPRVLYVWPVDSHVLGNWRVGVRYDLSKWRNGDDDERNDPIDQSSCSRFRWHLGQLLAQVLWPMPDIPRGLYVWPKDSHVLGNWRVGVRYDLSKWKNGDDDERNDPIDQSSCSSFCWDLCQLLDQVLCSMPDIPLVLYMYVWPVDSHVLGNWRVGIRCDLSKLRNGDDDERNDPKDQSLCGRYRSDLG